MPAVVNTRGEWRTPWTYYKEAGGAGAGVLGGEGCGVHICWHILRRTIDDRHDALGRVRVGEGACDEVVLHVDDDERRLGGQRLLRLVGVVHAEEG